MDAPAQTLAPGPVADRATLGRVRLLAVVLGTTAILAALGGTLWPEPSGGAETYSYADIAPQRDLWWGLLGTLAWIGVISVPLQAVATMILVRSRGHVWVTVGGAAMWLGIGLQALGVAGWAAAYFYPTDPALDEAVGSAVVEAANNDLGHLLGPLAAGAVLVIVGTVLQCVGLLRARVVPVWVPIAALSSILTLLVPGSGMAGLITGIPMAAAAVALGYYAVRTVETFRTESRGPSGHGGKVAPPLSGPGLPPPSRQA